MTSTRFNTGRGIRGFARRLFCLAAIACLSLIVSLPERALAGQRVFYAIGSAGYRKPQFREVGKRLELVSPPSFRDVRLYEVDTATLRVVRSLGLPGGFGFNSSGMLDPERGAIVISDGEWGPSTVMRVSAPALTVQSVMKIDIYPGVNCMENTFVQPVTGLAYFSCNYGSDSSGLLAVDTIKKKVVTDIKRAGGQPMAYDRRRQRLYILNSGAITIVSPRNRVLSYIEGPTARAGKHRIGSYIRGAALLPDGNLVLITNFGRSALTFQIYDPDNKKVLRSRTEKETFKVVEDAGLSKDGARLFVDLFVNIKESDRAILFDTATLKPLRRWILPEQGRPWPEKCFVPAPDKLGGMWFFGRSGKIYRLDDHDGKLLGEVKLPFHLISLVREK